MLWLFKTENCLSCQMMDYHVRRVQVKFGADVPLVAVHVGADADSLIPRSFFFQKRLDVSRTITVAPREFGARFSQTDLPAVLVVSNGRIAWSSVSVGGPAGASIRLDSVVGSLRNKAVEP